MNDSNSLWGSRFAGGPSASLAALSRSVHFDWRLAKYDIAGTRAHIKALMSAGYLTTLEHEKLDRSLVELASRVESGSFTAKPTDEDVHSALERGLIEIAGPELGGKVRAGRSRNDQIATLIRIYLLDQSQVLHRQVIDLIEAILTRAEEHLGVAMPGRTHFQHAQPVLLSHHLLAHIWPLVRDLERLQDFKKRASLSTYGAGALAGNTLGLDPNLVAAELGLLGPTENSIDATASRDVVAEFLFITTLISINLSRFSEEIIIWASAEFDYIKLHDSFSTGSSIMPQKKNPDVPELARGKTGRVVGHLMGLITLMKGQPLAYNKDNQEDKEPLFDTVDTLKDTLRIFAEMIGGQTTASGAKEGGLTVNAAHMEAAAKKGHATATDLADYLVKKGLPFRAAHETVARAVKAATSHNCDLSELPLNVLQGFHPSIEKDVYECLSLKGSLNARNTLGGTAPAQVKAQIARHQKRLA